MDTIRLILMMALIFILLLLYQAWQEDYGSVHPKKGESAAIAEESATPTTTSTELPTTIDKPAPPVEAVPASASTQHLIPTESRIHVKTDVLKLEIDTFGGDIRQVELLTYPVDIDNPEMPFRLLDDALPHLFIAQSGLLPPEHAPTHQAVYQSQQQHYSLNEQEQTLQVSLYWHNPQGLEVEKIYTFERGSYTIKLEHQVKNNSAEPWQGRLYAQLQRTENTGVKQAKFIYTYTGGAISSPEQRYEKISFAEMQEKIFKQEQRPAWQEGWAAMLQHYFLAAWVPKPQQKFHYYTNVLTQEAQRYVLGLYGPMQTVEPQQQHRFSFQLYIGPKLQNRLADLAPGLELTVDYGWLWFIAQPLFWLLTQLHQLVGNWGWAIIILTMLIKLVFFQLSATSYKSMANMRRLQPRLMALKDRYGDNKAGLNQAMMELYKKEKVNPLGGCLPILVQIPVFIALYWVLLESVELRQADFILWINDLSSSDPYFVLPLLMGATMLLQQHLNPAPIDPVQQKVMMILPLVFTVFFAFFPSGLVLYWVVNNILSIAQQWVITHRIVGNTQ